nr:FMN-binding negative transcriptional regulator [Streptomyces sp. C8S0]
MYRVTDPGQLHGIIRHHPMAMLVSNGPTTPFTTLLPIVHLPDAARGLHRLAPRPPQPSQPALAGPGRRHPASLVFSGPSGYVTPALYDTPVAAPTWNSVTAELTGDLVPLPEGEETLEVVRRTAELFEQRFGQGWDARGSVDYFRSIVSGVGAFRFDVTSAQAMFKLSQEKSPAVRDRVAKSMLDDGDGTRRALGAHMCRMGRTTETARQPALWGGAAEPECLLTGLARTVAERPDELALVDEDTRLTYAELWAWVAELATTLTRHGIEPGSRVAVTGGRGAHRRGPARHDRRRRNLRAAGRVLPGEPAHVHAARQRREPPAPRRPRPAIADEVESLAVEDPPEPEPATSGRSPARRTCRCTSSTPPDRRARPRASPSSTAAWTTWRPGSAPTPSGPTCGPHSSHP